MKSVETKSNILKVSDKLKAGLGAAGRKRYFPQAHVLFREDSESAGVFLLCKGRVLMGVRNLAKLDNSRQRIANESTEPLAGSLGVEV